MENLEETRLYNGGEWTKARWNSFVKSALRSASLRWPARYKTLNASKTLVKTNVKTGRLAQHHRCKQCQLDFPAKDVRVDHIQAIIDPAIGFTSWDDVIDRMFCEADNLQVLCTTCHNEKTTAEKQQSKERKANAKFK